MEILIDTSIWIDYFKGGGQSAGLDFLISENAIVTNDIILAELIPFIHAKKELELISLLQAIKKYPLNIPWDQIIDYQIRCLQGGANGIGIPDLIIAQNAIQTECPVYTLDRHFTLMAEILGLRLYTL